MLYSEDWDKHFLAGRSPRPIQAKALVRAAEILDRGKNVIAELPTGVGKSFIAHCLASTSGDGYIITSDNQLVSQYERDFKDVEEFSSIMGRRNYTCDTLSDAYSKKTCLDGHDDSDDETGDTSDPKSCRRMEYKKGDMEEGGLCASGECHCDIIRGIHVKEWPTCGYAISRLKAIGARVAFSNIHYYATAMRYDFEAWGFRKLTVFDEAHSLESALFGMVEISLAKRALNAIEEMSIGINQSMLTKLESEEDWEAKPKWIPSHGRPLDMDEVAILAVTIVKEIDEVEQFIQDEWAEVTEKQKKALKRLSTLRNNLRTFLETRHRIPWIADLYEYNVNEDKYRTMGAAQLLIRPVVLSDLTESLIFRQSKRFVFQSATIIDGAQFAEDLGIKDYEGFAFKTPFPPSNRPIYPLSVGSLSHKNYKDNIDKFVAKLEQILEARPNQKGIVHTTSYEIQRYLQKKLKPNPRYLFPTSSERQETLEQKHILSKEPTVLFSPAMTQGVDLAGELARFCVVFKIAYPYLGDRRVAKRKEMSENWYQYTTAKTLIQAIGRGVRSETDWCDIFILDSAFWGLYNNYGKLQNYLKDSIEWNKEKCERAIYGRS